jgi:hypothetical protein
MGPPEEVQMIFFSVTHADQVFLEVGLSEKNARAERTL